MLVKALMMSVMKITDQADNSIFLLTWDEYAKAKEDAQYFFGVIDTLKEKYNDRLHEYFGDIIMRFMSDKEIPDKVHEMLYAKWLEENGYTQKDFESAMYDELLEFLGINYDTLLTTRRKNTTLFASYMTSIKNQYKNILVDAYSLEQFKNDKIKNDDALSTLLAYKVEETAGIYASICSEIGISYEEYTKGVNAFTTFAFYANKLRTEFDYTLKTEYSESEIKDFEYNDIDVIVYDVLSKSGFYTSEMSMLITSNLNAYNRDKSAAKDYNKYFLKVTTALEADLNKAGYTLADVNAMSMDDAAEVIYAVVLEKYFSDAITVEDILASISGEYINGVMDADSPSAFVSDAANAMKSSGIYSSFIYYLNNAMKEERTKIEG